MTSVRPILVLFILWSAGHTFLNHTLDFIFALNNMNKIIDHSVCWCYHHTFVPFILLYFSPGCQVGSLGHSFLKHGRASCVANNCLFSESHQLSRLHIRHLYQSINHICIFALWLQKYFLGLSFNFFPVGSLTRFAKYLAGLFFASVELVSENLQSSDALWLYGASFPVKPQGGADL